MEPTQKTDVRRIVYTVLSLVFFVAELVLLICFFIEMLQVANAGDWSALALIVLLPLFLIIGIGGVLLSFVFALLARRRLRILPPEKHSKLWRALTILLLILPAAAFVGLGVALQIVL